MADDTPQQGAEATAKAGPRRANKRTAARPAASTGSKRRQATDAGPLEMVAATVAPALEAVSEPIKAVATSTRRRARVATKPITDSVAPATRSISDGAKSVASAVRRSSTSARRRIAAAPAEAGKSAVQAFDSLKTAATGRTAALVGAAAAGLLAGLTVNLGRKAVVQAPSIMAGDWFEALKTEHKLALALFDQLEATADTEPAKRAILLTQLKHALGKHAFTEENVVYPALRDWGDKADADKLNHDHGYVKQHLYELDGLDNDSPAFLARVAVFRVDLTDHIREEEDAIFPPLHAALGDAKNAQITALANKEGFKLA